MDIDYDFHRDFVERGEWWEVVESHVREDTGKVEAKFVHRYCIEDRADAVEESLGGGYASSIDPDTGIIDGPGVYMRAELYRVKSYWPSEYTDDGFFIGPVTELTPAPPTEEEKRAAYSRIAQSNRR